MLQSSFVTQLEDDGKPLTYYAVGDGGEVTMEEVRTLSELRGHSQRRCLISQERAVRDCSSLTNPALQVDVAQAQAAAADEAHQRQGTCCAGGLRN